MLVLQRLSYCCRSFSSVQSVADKLAARDQEISVLKSELLGHLATFENVRKQNKEEIQRIEAKTQDEFRKSLEPVFRKLNSLCQREASDEIELKTIKGLNLISKQFNKQFNFEQSV